MTSLYDRPTFFNVYILAMIYTILWIVSNIIFIPDAIAITKTLTYKDDVCGGAYEHNRKQSFNVIYAGERMGSICKDMSFRGWDGDEGASYESCVTVTTFDIVCGIQLEYRAGSSRGKASKTYDCLESASSIPMYCTKEILYIRLTAKTTNPSSVEYTVSSGAEETVKSAFESASSTVWIGPVIIAVVIFIVAISVICIRKKRAAAFAQQNQCPVVGYTTQQPLSTQHQQAYMYTPVNQTIIPPSGAAPQQPQGYYLQQTNYTHQSTAPHPYPQPNQQPYQQSYLQQTNYQQSSQPSIQQRQPDMTPSVPPVFASSNTDMQFSTLQSEPSLPPPSYEEIQKQKL